MERWRAVPVRRPKRLESRQTLGVIDTQSRSTMVAALRGLGDERALAEAQGGARCRMIELLHDWKRSLMWGHSKTHAYYSRAAAPAVVKSRCSWPCQGFGILICSIAMCWRSKT